MAKILISFVGTGRRNIKDEAKRAYETAAYSLEGKELGNYSFVSLALSDVVSPDKIFLIGTAHSMWEEVYHKFSIKNNTDFDESIWTEIADNCEKNDRHSVLEIPHQEEIEKAMGTGSIVSLIKYGVDEKEIKENINIILSLERYINHGDELIIDITHAFRSLPLYIMQLLMYLKTISKKKINISHVFYGMYEAKENREDPAPIVDLVSLININDWIIGAYSLQNYGNGTMISALIEDENKNVANLIDDFSKAMSLNHIMAIKKQIQRLSGIRYKEYSSLIPSLIINPSIKEFIDTFNNVKKFSLFELKLAEWQSKHHNYAAAYISIVEAIITYVCETNGLDHTKTEDRLKAKNIIYDKDKTEYKTIRSDFTKLNENRKKVAHSIEATISIIKMINDLNEGIKTFNDIIK